MDYVKNTIAENFGGPASALGTHQFRLDQCPDLTGQVAVVTGGSEGIGYGVTHTLLSHNIARVFILSPSASVVAGAGAALANELGPAAAARTAWLQCDLADWAAVAAVADRIAREAPRLDVLVNNAGRGIMTAERTDYGVDRHMAVMHFGHVILTSRLLPLMKRTAADRGVTVRISNQASNVHNLAPRDTRFESLEEINEDVGPNGQYGRAKLAVMLYARWFARHVTNAGHPRLLMNSTHPGFVSTKMSKVDIFEAFPLGGYGMAVAMEPFKKDQFEGAVPTIYAVTTTTESGQYICPPAIPEPGSQLAQSDELADRLMELTKKVILEKGPIDELVLS